MRSLTGYRAELAQVLSEGLDMVISSTVPAQARASTGYVHPPFDGQWIDYVTSPATFRKPIVRLGVTLIGPSVDWDSYWPWIEERASLIPSVLEASGKIGGVRYPMVVSVGSPGLLSGVSAPMLATSFELSPIHMEITT